MKDHPTLSANDEALLQQILDDVVSCGKTSVPYLDLMRFASMGFLECTSFRVTGLKIKEKEKPQSLTDSETIFMEKTLDLATGRWSLKPIISEKEKA